MTERGPYSYNGGAESLPGPSTTQEAIKTLKERELGRALHLAQKNITSGEIEAGDLIGYVLPLQPDQLKHIVLFNTDRIFVIKPSGEEEGSKTKYKRWFTPTPIPLIISNWKNVDGFILSFLPESDEFKSEVILENNNPETIEDIKRLIDLGIAEGARQSRYRVIARAETSRHLLKNLSSPPQEGDIYTQLSLRLDMTKKKIEKSDTEENLNKEAIEIKQDTKTSED